MLLVLLATCGAEGWLYLLRDTGVLNAGPDVPGALPLEQLAGHDAQPLLAVAVAWIPAGLLIGWALRRLGRLSTLATGLTVAITAYATLVVAGAGSDAAAISESLGSHIGAQFGRAGVLVGAALMAAGALMGARARRGGEAAATPP